jgi:hypothetical protein
VAGAGFQVIDIASERLMSWSGTGELVAKIDPDRERQRLNALYVQMSDEQLEKVGSDPAALTEWARESLRPGDGPQRLEVARP